VVAGLGNPGPTYAHTRHNLGYEVLDLLAGQLGISFRPRARAAHAVSSAGGRQIVLIKPTTFMNLSGQAVGPFLRRNGVSPASLLVIHDDLDLQSGRIRMRRGGSAGGHRGVQSIMDALGTAEFARLKIGIGRPPVGVDPVDYVLLRPAPAEREALATAVRVAADACQLWLCSGIEAAMNLYNSVDASTAAGQPDGPAEQKR